MKSRQRVVITGLGLVTPVGVGVETFWQNCLDGKARVEPIPEAWRSHYANYRSTLWAPLPALPLEQHGLTRFQAKQLDASQQLSIIAADQALDDAGFTRQATSPRKTAYQIPGQDMERWGVYMGTGIGGVSSLITNVYNHLYAGSSDRDGDSKSEESELAGGGSAEIRRFNRFVVAMTMPNACAARLALRYVVHGPVTTVSAACASGTVAMGHALSAIRQGQVDRALVGGVEYVGDELGSIFRSFDVAGTLVRNCAQASNANRPFDRERSGFLFAEGGAAVLLLERADLAEQRGARIYAEMVGYAENSDASSIMSLDPSGVQVRRLYRDLLSDCGWQASDVDYVNGHGTGTEINDQVETAALESVFGTKPVVNSTKSLTGHLMGGSGAVEAAVTALTLFHGQTHGCVNLDNPVRDLNFARGAVRGPFQRAISESFGFGGHNAALALQRV